MAVMLLLLYILAACTPLAQPGPAPSGTLPANQTAAPTVRPARTATFTPVIPSPSVTPTSAIRVQPDDLQGQILVFWHPFQSVKQAQLEQMTAEFNQQNEWGIRVQAVSQEAWGILDERVRQGSAAQPDVLLGYNTQALQWDVGGWLLADLGLYVNDPIWGLTAKEISAYYPTIWAQDYVPDGMLNGKAQPGGKRLGLPFYRTATLLAYNAAWGRKLGFSQPPRTAGEIQAQACAAAQAAAKDPENAIPGSGGLLVTDGAGLLSSLIFAFGGEIARPDRSGYQFDTPLARQAVEYLGQLAANGCVWRSPEVSAVQAIGQRQALFVTLSSAELAAVQAGLQAQGFADEWQVLPFYSPEGQPVVGVYGPALLVTQSLPERQLAAWLFVRCCPARPTWLPGLPPAANCLFLGRLRSHCLSGAI